MRRRRRHLALLLLAGLSHASIVDWKINEELDEGEMIFNIPHEIKLAREPTGYTFKVVPQNDYLKVNPDSSSGIILETGPKAIDRETVCPTVFKPNEKCIMKDYTILAMNGFEVEQHRLRLEVLDINDNKPVFPHDNISLDISENSMLGQSIRLESATDRDPDFGIVSYELKGFKPIFELNEERNEDGTIIPSLRLKKELDREKTAEYQLVLSAFDRNDNQASANVTINVIDVNDNAPYFVRPPTDAQSAETPSVSINLKEDAQIGDLVYQVEASDKDSTSQGHITYEFHSANNALVTDAFIIDEKSGEIRVNGPLDFDQTTRHNIYVIASDGEHQIHCTITVNILDTNDQRPVIVISYIPGYMQNNSVTFPENIPKDTPLFWVSVSDSDPGEAGQVTTSIDDNDFFKLERKPKDDPSENEEQYIIYANGEFDREQKETFELIITAHDNGVPQLVSREMLTINLEDVNDNTPEFRSKVYQKTLSEADQPGTVVFTLSDKVKDDDYGRNGQFSFALLENGEGIFELVEDQIILTRMLDIDGISEKTDEYTLKVQVRDHGDEPKSSSAEFKVKIGDINDSKPTFTKSHYNFTLSEIESQIASSVLVGTVIATDLDKTEKNKAIIYRIDTAPNQLVNFPFELDSRTGQIWTNRTLDRDNQNLNFRWDFSIAAENEVPVLGHSDSFSRAQVTITLVDENDHKPKIERITTASGEALEGSSLTNPVNVIHRNPQPYLPVIKSIQSSDGDVDAQNRKVLYSLVDSDSAWFNIDAEKGRLTYTGEASKYGCHALTVVVRNEATLQDDADWYQQKINVYFARDSENVTDIEKLIKDSCSGNTFLGVNFADIQTTLIAIIIGVALILFIIIAILIVRCRWKKNKGQGAKRTKSGHLLSATTQDGTLDSRNDFEGDWNRPQLAHGMSPQHYQQNPNHPHHPGDAGNHSFTSKDSGTGDSVPTENHQFIGSPEAMRFASDQHKIGYGDESWATNSMLRHQSHKSTVQGNLPQEYIPRTTSESPYSSYHPQSPPSHEHASPPVPVAVAPPSQPPHYNHYGSYRRSQKPTFSTFVDNHSETSSMSAALINGHMSPDFDRMPSSATNTLERRPTYSDYGELGPATIPENMSDRQSNQRFA